MLETFVFARPCSVERERLEGMTAMADTADDLGWIGGGCRCSQVRIAVSGPPLVTMACHCTGCQRMTGSAFSLSSLYPADRFALVEGETVPGGLKGGTRHHFCPACLSWLYTVPEGLDAFVNVRATMLDDARDFVPFVEVWTRERLPWAVTGAAHAFETVPASDDFGRLIEAYAAQRR